MPLCLAGARYTSSDAKNFGSGDAEVWGIIVPVTITHIIAALFTAATMIGAPAIGGAAVENTPTTTPPHHQPTSALWRDLTPTCSGTGNDGARVQAVYAHEAGTHSQFHRAEPIIRRELARIDSTFDLSARKTGSGRRVRWVSTHCRPHIATITVPPPEPSLHPPA
ncbi:Uncharacterised protein [Dermatophilus congolensis]|uniref:Uncharacterized protein n=1 Tax=Dermatophilus congolensis TaxID=1863 RepID=A0AA46BMG2_9MICO|nr:Uncharacterised protein [Dermatophilus congolensis]